MRRGKTILKSKQDDRVTVIGKDSGILHNIIIDSV